jgi:G3E family GTPase
MQHFPSPDIGMFGRRQSRSRGHRIPVSIVVRGTDAPQCPDAAVLVDTFGASDVIPRRNGCQCCTVRAGLQTALRRLLADRARGTHFARVVIETDGDIGTILRTFAADRELCAQFHVEGDWPMCTHAGDTRFVLTEDALSWDAFSRFMMTLVALRGTDLLHVKGVLNVVGCRGPVLVQFIQHLAHPPIELQAWPDDERTSRIAFVTRGVEEKTVRELFDAVRAFA